MTARLTRPIATSSVALAVLVGSLYAALTGSARAAAPDVGTEAQRESGKKIYLKNCSQCHGDKGDGEGYAAPHLHPKPRDFTAGKFKVRTTPNGALPTHQDLVAIIRRGMPYTSMPAWPNLSDQEVSDVAYFITTFSPDFSNAEKAPQPMSLPGAPKATKESIELGKKLYAETGCARCHGTLGRGDGPSAPTLVDDWKNPIRPADLAQSWTFRGGSSREDIFRTMSTGLNGTPMPSFLDALKPEQRWAITDFIVSLSGSNGPGYSNLVSRQARPGSDRPGKGNREFPIRARGPLPAHRADHRAGARVPSSDDVGDRPGDLRRRLGGRPRSMARHERGEDREERPDAASASVRGRGGGTSGRPARRLARRSFSGGGSLGEAGGSKGSVWGGAEAAPTQQPPKNPFEEEAAPAAQASEFSDAVAIQIPSQVPTGARKPYFIFGDVQNPVDLWFFDLARPDPLQFTGKGSGDVTANDTGDLTGVASYDQGEWSVIFKRPIRATSGASFSPGGFLPIAFSVWDGFSRERGSRRALTIWYSLYVEPEVVPSAVGPMVQTALFVLVIELAVIGWVRWRRRSRARGNLGDEPSQPAPTRA